MYIHLYTINNIELKGYYDLSLVYLCHRLYTSLHSYTYVLFLCGTNHDIMV